MGSTSAKASTTRVGEYDQYWLDHQAAQAASGKTAKEYAADEGLSLQAFYQARKKLHRSGLLSPYRVPSTATTKKGSRKGSVSFSKVAVVPSTLDARFRLELPSGIALEWSGGDVPESVATLLERLAHLS